MNVLPHVTSAVDMNDVPGDEIARDQKQDGVGDISRVCRDV